MNAYYVTSSSWGSRDARIWGGVVKGRVVNFFICLHIHTSCVYGRIVREIVIYYKETTHQCVICYFQLIGGQGMPGYGGYWIGGVKNNVY